MNMLTKRFQVIDDAPDQSICKSCNSICRLLWCARRAAIDITSAVLVGDGIEHRVGDF